MRRHINDITVSLDHYTVNVYGTPHRLIARCSYPTMDIAAEAFAKMDNIESVNAFIDAHTKHDTGCDILGCCHRGPKGVCILPDKCILNERR